jgi:hypothetical protein
LAHFLEDEEPTERLTCPACGTIFQWDKLSNSATIFYTEKDESTTTAITEESGAELANSYQADDQQPLSPDELNLKVSKVQKDLELERDLRRWRFIQIFVFATICLTLLGTLNGVVKEHKSWWQALSNVASPAIILGLAVALGVSGLIIRSKLILRLFSTAFRIGKKPDVSEIAEEFRRSEVARRPLPPAESLASTYIDNQSICTVPGYVPPDSIKAAGSTSQDQGMQPSA